MVITGCTPTATAPPISGQPLRLAHGSAEGLGVSDVTRGEAVIWLGEVANDASEPLVVDAYQLVGASAGLTVVSAGGWGVDPLSPAVGPGLVASADARTAIAARPLVGWTFTPSTTGGRPQYIVFLVQAAANGSYSISSIALRSHAGEQHFETELAARFELCVGANVPSGGVCPFATPAASPAPGT